MLQGKKFKTVDLILLQSLYFDARVTTFMTPSEDANYIPKILVTSPSVTVVSSKCISFETSGNVSFMWRYLHYLFCTT